MTCESCLKEQRSNNLIILLHSVIEEAQKSSINNEEIMDALFMQIKLLSVPQEKDFYTLRGTLQDMLESDLYSLWVEFHGE